MLKRCILAENRKLHASPIWAMFFVLPILSATYGTFNYLQNLEILTDGWYSLWTQHTLFYSMLFFPAMVATYAAYLWRLEHLGHNWNLIMASPVPPLDLFAAKFAVVTKLALLTHGFVFALFVFCGKVFAHLPGWPPVRPAALSAAGVAGCVGCHCRTAGAGHDHPQLCRAHFSGAAGRHYRYFYQFQGLWAAVALFPDAARNELQQKCRCSGWQLRAVCSQLSGVAGGVLSAGASSAAQRRCPGLSDLRRNVHKICLKRTVKSGRIVPFRR